MLPVAPLFSGLQLTYKPAPKLNPRTGKVSTQPSYRGLLTTDILQPGEKPGAVYLNGGYVGDLHEVEMGTKKLASSYPPTSGEVDEIREDLAGGLELLDFSAILPALKQAFPDREAEIETLRGHFQQIFRTVQPSINTTSGFAKQRAENGREPQYEANNMEWNA